MSGLNSVHIPRTLTIAGSYSDGCAGIQVDLKTFTALSTCGLSVVTALAARETSDVNAIHTVPEDFVSSQFHALVSDMGVDALKIGMLLSPSLINCVISLITKTQIPIIVLDPVVITTQSSSDSLTILCDQLLPIVTLVTLTVNEAAILLDRDIVSLDDIRCASQDLHRLGSKYVMIMGDHLALSVPQQTQADSVEDDVIVDVLFDGLNFTLFKSSRLPTKTAYSIRCALSAAITAFLAYGIDVKLAIENAIAYTHSVVQSSGSFDCNNDALKRFCPALVDQLRNEPLNRTEICKSLVINKQQQSSLESANNVIIVSNHSWIKEPRVLSPQRSFVQLLKNACAQEWHEHTHHRFVEGLANGTLPHASFKHYLIQDYIFLTHFARCKALAGYKSNNMTGILRAAKAISGIAHESELHVSYCVEWGIDPTSLASAEEARANLAYTRFTLDCGMAGDLVDLYVALLPCLLGYGEIGLRLFEDSTTKRDSPYWKWITSYAADDYQKACREGEQLIEELVDEYGVWHATARIKKLTDIFKIATKLEIGFWNMGFNVEW